MRPEWFAFFSDWVRQYNKRQVSVSATRYPVTGSTDVTVAATMSATVGNSGSFRLTLNTSTTSNANAKTIIVKSGSTTILTATVDASTAFQSLSIQVTGRAASSQYLAVTNMVNCSASSGALTLDTSGNITLTVSLQLGTTTDTIALESWALDVESA